VLRVGVALGAAAILPPSRACEFYTSTLRVIHPWTRATGEATTAVLCMRIDEVSEEDALIGVATPVASGAELVAPDGSVGELFLPIPAGRETILSDDGVHVRLTGLLHPLLIARQYPLKLQFQKGGQVLANLNVDFLRPALPVAPPSPTS